jgi:membrane-associated phospholipid phosphatase
VLGGAVIGALCGLLSVWLYRKFFQKRFPLI